MQVLSTSCRCIIIYSISLIYKYINDTRRAKFTVIDSAPVVKCRLYFSPYDAERAISKLIFAAARHYRHFYFFRLLLKR